MRALSFFIVVISATFTLSVNASLSLDTAVQDALDNDHWVLSNRYSENAMRADAIASGELPDPKMRVALANLPIDSFDFNQENMTQLQLGLSQQFPRGNSLEVRQQQLNLMADLKPLERQNRRALIKKQVSQLWLQLHQTQEQLVLLKRYRYIFDELIAVSRGNYRSGKIQRFELLDAELQLTRFDDRVAALIQRKAQLKRGLSEWLSAESQTLSDQLPTSLPELAFLLSIAELEQDHLLNHALLNHPVLRQVDQTIAIREKGIELADEAYKPGFKVDANYGYRDEMESGVNRDDFFSMSVTFDLPIFPEKRQDAKRNAAINQREAAKEQRLLKLRSFKAQLEAELADLNGINQRIKIYDQQFLHKLSHKRKAAIKAYSSADAGYKDVSAAAMSELETKLVHIELLHRRALTEIKINYLLSGLDTQIQSASHSVQQEYK
ncbi:MULTISPECIES: TolC family protein [unclassified Neptuniibacter]|uniref:TolC family protein n=1 Tax=unclassified Neptuniibacter TaxID=2630693 RepID=UPI0025EEFE1E|nr:MULTISPECIES: TolC family protein [unclassified Neptuniibacter]|tara:strand:- start:17882 stop:19198 length:1317 start_codon:yes stop_codon:yes gene_type:complete